MTLTIGSVCAGYGGIDLALHDVLGAEPKWFCEFDDAPSKILANHWPDVPNHRDMTTVDWATVDPVDIICGGTPCQDLSLAGRRAGMTDGTRSNLWVAMREAIATIKPRLVVWENVLGALSATASSASDMESDQGLLGGGATGHLRALGRVLGDLTEIGYDAEWTTLRASDVGAPHHRARVFLIAYPADAGCVGLQASRRGGGPGAAQSGPVGGAGALPAVNHLPTPNASDGTGGWQPMSQREGHTRQLIDAVLDMPHLPTPTVADSDRERNNPAQAKRHSPPLSATLAHFDDTSIFGKYEPVVHRWEQVTGITAPAPTELNKNGKPRLNAAFAEWMMGLPAGWITQVPGITRSQKLKAAGNGVVPQQAAAALRHLIGEACQN